MQIKLFLCTLFFSASLFSMQYPIQTRARSNGYPSPQDIEKYVKIHRPHDEQYGLFGGALCLAEEVCWMPLCDDVRCMPNWWWFTAVSTLCGSPAGCYVSAFALATKGAVDRRREKNRETDEQYIRRARQLSPENQRKLLAGKLKLH